MMADDFDLDDVEQMDIPDVDNAPEPVIFTPPAPEPTPTAPEPVISPPAPPAPSASDNPTTRETQVMLHAQEKVKILIPSTEIDKDDVHVSVNGYAYVIKRDEEVLVPDSIYRALKDAKVKIYTPVPRKDGEGNEMVEQEVQRIPFSVVR